MKTLVNLLEEGRKILRFERLAIEEVENNLGQPFLAAIQVIMNAPGNVIFSGVGKSGHVGRKLAATFASTGTTAYFVHADEAAHGDLGMIKKGDVFIGLSFSGESDELMTIIPVLKKWGIPIIAMTGRANSSLAKIADVALVTEITREACPLNLAPTSSTTVTMALGDAIAAALMIVKNFSKEDFARSHPAGALGRRLLLSVGDVMRTTNLPIVPPKIPVIDAIQAMAKSHLGCFVCADEENRPLGIFTEGDLCRLMRTDRNIKECTVEDVMTVSPKTIGSNEPAHAAMSLIKEHQINNLIVLSDEGNIVGLVHIQDLVAKKII